MTWAYIVLECYCFKKSPKPLRGKGKRPEGCPHRPCIECKIELNCTHFAYADVTECTKVKEKK
jgi:hypothetical protein